MIRSGLEKAVILLHLNGGIQFIVTFLMKGASICGVYAGMVLKKLYFNGVFCNGLEKVVFLSLSMGGIQFLLTF